MKPPSSSTCMTPDTAKPSLALNLIVFVTLWIAYGWFCQSGGWNQNARWSQVRAIVEGGELSINRYCMYAGEITADGSTALQRVELTTSCTAAEAWWVINSGDTAYVDGRIYPNKPPGTTLLALPGYVVARGIQRMAGLDPDSWWGITLGGWIATILSVGLMGALGGVLFLHCSWRLFPDIPGHVHVLATFGYALGTLAFPYATVMFDHVPVATLLLATFGLCLSVIQRGGLTSRDREGADDVRIQGCNTENQHPGRSQVVRSLTVAARRSRSS
ncbi:MAG: hypothetical protein IT440_01945, partial [Phycisphaeraceae bacterium]|nr:hypothetical protein [Phycisphaeraceae bacterium]